LASHYLRKYGAEAIIPFELYKLDGTGLKTDAASATGDITLYRDEGSNEVLDADAFVDEGVSYSLVLSATEMTAKHIIVHIIDQSSPQVWLDKVLIVETYGNASAQHIFDLGLATQSVNVASIDNIDFGNTMKASINAEVDTALNTAIPGSPTADSINERVATMDGSVATILTNTTALKKIGTNKWAIIDTSYIIYDDNGSTPLYTFTLDSATAPTSRTPT
jgi:hypothetical protein